MKYSLRQINETNAFFEQFLEWDHKIFWYRCKICGKIAGGGLTEAQYHIIDNHRAVIEQANPHLKIYT